MGLLARLRAFLARLRAFLARLFGPPRRRRRRRAGPPGEFRSRGGLLLRSRGEQMIANWLDDRGYRWEYEARVAGFTPDFVLRDERVLVEYWGMKGHNKRYDAKIDEKKRRYRREGWTVIGVERRHLSRLDDRLGKRLKRPKQPRQPKRGPG